MTTMDSPSTSSSEPWKRRRVKHCFVPHCLSSSTLFPYKEFLGVPRDPTQRKMWMDAVGLKSSFIPSQNMQCCEDHFDMEKDILNCSKYRGYLQLKKGVIPHKFDHQRHSKNKHDTKQKVDNEHKIECLDPKAPLEEQIGTISSDHPTIGEPSTSKDITETTVIPTNVEDSLPSCGEARVKSERILPQFCLACFAVDRTLTPPGDLLGLYCSLVEDWEIPQQPVYLCWECRALLRRVRDFTRNVATVHAFLQEYQRDQDTPLPPPLSRLVQATMEGEVPARPITTGLTEVKVKHEGPGTPEVVYYDVKLEPKDEDDVQSDDHIWKDEEPASADTVRDRKTPSESRKKPKQKKENNKKYVYVNNENFCLEDFYTKVPINHAELTSLLEQDRQSEQFLQQPHRCEDCFHGWKMKGSKMEHDLRRHGDVSLSYQCDICKIRLGGKMQLSVHIREHYFARQCGQCGYCTATRYLMRKHVLREHRKRVQCRTCDAQFYELREFHRHYRASHSVGQFQCDHCGQRRTTRAAIERHIKRHMERRKLERPYCVECDKYFRTFETYKQHLISKAHGVNNSGRVACPACGKTYARAGYMRAHYACVHLARPRYKCAHCGQCCLDNSAYRDHMRRRHTPGYKKPRPKVCPYCERNFASKFHLDNHVRTHTGERPFACEFCPARFGAKTALQSHVDYTHLKRKRKTYGPRIRKTSDVEPA